MILSESTHGHKHSSFNETLQNGRIMAAGGIFAETTDSESCHFPAPHLSENNVFVFYRQAVIKQFAGLSLWTASFWD